MTNHLDYILARPHMMHLATLPGIDDMPTFELQMLDSFMRFCGDQALDDPMIRDIRAFGSLHEVSAHDMLCLQSALELLEIEKEVTQAAGNVAWEIFHRENFKFIPNVCNHQVTFTCSVPEKEFPQDWQDTLINLRCKQVHAPSILERMVQRLGAFRFSAISASLKPELNDPNALRCFYLDLRARSAERNDGVQRWAYLRSAFEELHRFAKAHGYDQQTIDLLQSKEYELAMLEDKQDPLKMAKAAGIPDAPDLLISAESILDAATKERLPQRRHAHRNRAAAIAIGMAIPARPIDVFEKHIFGKGIFFDEHTGLYRFRYKPKKTRIGGLLNISLSSYWNQFIDALILQDNDPSYLWELRQKALDEHRPLYVLYNGQPSGPSYYSNCWRAVVGTGGQIARTKVYDSMADLGEFGILYSKAVCHHHSETIPAKYRSDVSIKKSYKLAADIMIKSAGNMHDDISDLLI